jgi:uncharacterized membrane protein YbhN (UPF0104 family)
MEAQMVFGRFIAYGVIFGGILLVIGIYLRDRTNKLKRKIKNFIEILPITGLMTSKDRIWRLVLAFQISASEMLILALTGGYYKHMSKDADFTLANVFKGVICLLVSQAYTLSIIIVNFSILKHENSTCTIIFSLIISLSVFIISAGSIIFFTFEDMANIEYLWLSSFIISSVLDVFVVQTIYSLILKTRKQWVEVAIVDHNAKVNATEISFAKMNKDEKYQRRGFSDLPLVVEDNIEMNETPRENMHAVEPQEIVVTRTMLISGLSRY